MSAAVAIPGLHFWRRFKAQNGWCGDQALCTDRGFGERLERFVRRVRCTCKRLTGSRCACARYADADVYPAGSHEAVQIAWDDVEGPLVALIYPLAIRAASMSPHEYARPPRVDVASKIVSSVSACVGLTVYAMKGRRALCPCRHRRTVDDKRFSRLGCCPLDRPAGACSGGVLARTRARGEVNWATEGGYSRVVVVEEVLFGFTYIVGSPGTPTPVAAAIRS
jgi:hypothetical protein